MCTLGADKDEVDIPDHQAKPVAGRNYSIYAWYSIGPNRTLSWYLNGSPLKASPFVSMINDGLNIVLQLGSAFRNMYGTFSLQIDGTDTKDDFIIIPGIQYEFQLLLG